MSNNPNFFLQNNKSILRFIHWEKDKHWIWICTLNISKTPFAIVGLNYNHANLYLQKNTIFIAKANKQTFEFTPESIINTLPVTSRGLLHKRWAYSVKHWVHNFWEAFYGEKFGVGIQHNEKHSDSNCYEIDRW